MIKEIEPYELEQALNLVNDVFSEFVAVDYSEKGQNTFREYLKTKLDEVSMDISTGHKKMWGYYENGAIIGVIATRDISHIALMFVDKKYHRKGISRQLFDTVIENISTHAEIEQITVNSSPYAVAIYERLGFVKTDEQQEKDGILFTPMICPIKRGKTL